MTRLPSRGWARSPTLALPLAADGSTATMPYGGYVGALPRPPVTCSNYAVRPRQLGMAAVGQILLALVTTWTCTDALLGAGQQLRAARRWLPTKAPPARPRARR